MVNSTLDPLTTLEVWNDTYQMQRRPGTAHLLLNDGYTGLMVVDPWQGVVDRVAFPQTYGSGIIDDWYLAADGRGVVTLNVDDDQAALLWLDHHRPAQTLALPPLDHVPVNLASYWAADTLVLARRFQDLFVTLDVTAPILSYVEQSSIAIRMQYPAWRKGLDLLPAQVRSLARVEADREQLLYVAVPPSQPHIGVVNWGTQTAWTIPVPDSQGTPSMVAAAPHLLFALYEYDLQVLTAQGELLARVPPPAGFHYWGVDTIPAVPPHPPAVVVLASALSNVQHTRLLVYALPDVPNDAFGPLHPHGATPAPRGTRDDFGPPKVVHVRSGYRTDPRLVKLADAAMTSHDIERGVQSLITQVEYGNLDPRRDTKPMFGDVREWRHRNGARVYFRQVRDESVDIVGISDKARQQKVMTILMETYQ